MNAKIGFSTGVKDRSSILRSTHFEKFHPFQSRFLRLFRYRSYKNKGKCLSFFLKNWWVAIFIAMAVALYLQALYQKNQLAYLLKSKVLMLKKEKERAMQEKEQLLLRIKSEDDPEWILLVLKQRLGVVEEGETKVIFNLGNR